VAYTRAATGMPLLVAGLVAIVAVGLGGCGAGRGTIDARRLDGQISTGLAQRLAIAPPVVACPPGQRDARGVTFSCTTSVDGQALTITVQASDGQGNVRWQPASAIVSAERTAMAINQQFSAQLQTPVTSACGARRLVVVAVGATFSCSATVKGQPRQVTVSAQDLTGNVHLVLDPPASGPGATTPAVTAPTPPKPAKLPGG